MTWSPKATRPRWWRASHRSAARRSTGRQRRGGRRSVVRSADPVEAVIVEEALANQTDGYPMVTALVRRRLGVRPGFRVERPRQLWQLDLTSI